MPIRSLSCLVLLSAALVAQTRVDRPFAVDLTLGGGRFEHHTDGNSLDGSTAAGFFQLELEGVSRHGVGAGLRLEGIGSNDGLFDDAVAPRSEASASELFVHGTYVFENRHVDVPFRFGLLLHGYELDTPAVPDTLTASTLAFRLETEPEVTVVDERWGRWAIYGLLGFGFGGTALDSDAVTGEWTSDSAFFGAELGTRIDLGVVEVGVAWIHRQHEMDESDVDSGTSILGFETAFSGLAITFGARF